MPISDAAHLLTRTTHRRTKAPVQRFLGSLGMETARVHEMCGTGRRTLAVQLAGQSQGTVLWICPGWEPGRLNPDGMVPFADASRFLFAMPKRAEDLLWTAEEALRSGAVPLVIVDLSALPGLTAVRRLHLAAETGAATGARPPLGVLLTPGEGGAPGVESRWALTPEHEKDGADCWRLERLRARTAPVSAWSVRGARDGMKLAEPVAIEG